MAFDHYAQCPGGTGKKIKFCCADLVSELGKVIGLLQSDQPAACLEQIVRAEAKFPNRACLAALKTEAQIAMGHEEDAEKTLAEYAKKNPNNPMALAELAVFRLKDGDVKKSVDLLQRAVAATEGPPAPQIVDAYLEVGIQLAEEGYLPAGIKHLLQGFTLLGADEHALENISEQRRQSLFQTSQFLRELQSSRQLSPLLRGLAWLESGGEGEPWHAELERALAKAGKYRWRAAADQLAVLAVRFPQAALVHWNAAILQIALADEDQAAESLRKYAELTGFSPRAVAAQVMRLDLGSITQQHLVAAPELTWELADSARTIEYLQSHPLVDCESQIPQHLHSHSGPPPLLSAVVYDRPQPEDAASLPAKELPRVEALLLLFGKETDRPARVVMWGGTRTAAAALRNTASGLLASHTHGEPLESLQQSMQHIAELPSIGLIRLTKIESPEVAEKLAREAAISWVKDLIHEAKWPTLKFQSVAQAVQEPSLRTAAAAILQWLESLHLGMALDLDWEAEREQLGLPRLRDLAVPSLKALSAVPSLDVHRCDARTCQTAEVASALAARANSVHNSLSMVFAIQRAIELSGPDYGNTSHVLLGLWADIQPDRKNRLHWRRLAVANARAQDQDSSRQHLQWLVDLLGAMQFDELAPAVKDFLKYHGSNRAAMQSFYELFSRFGMVRPDGAIMLPKVASTESSLVLPGAAAESPVMGGASSRIWTPDAPEASATERKSILWTPGS